MPDNKNPRTPKKSIFFNFLWDFQCSLATASALIYLHLCKLSEMYSFIALHTLWCSPSNGCSTLGHGGWVFLVVLRASLHASRRPRVDPRCRPWYTGQAVFRGWPREWSLDPPPLPRNSSFKLWFLMFFLKGCKVWRLLDRIVGFFLETISWMQRSQLKRCNLPFSKMKEMRIPYHTSLRHPVMPENLSGSSTVVPSAVQLASFQHPWANLSVS